VVQLADHPAPQRTGTPDHSAVAPEFDARAALRDGFASAPETRGDRPASGARAACTAPELDERSARTALRHQVARLERLLAEALASGFPHTAPDVRVPGRAGPRLLSLGELERLRDDLADRLRQARAELAATAERQEAARALLECMLAEPGRHRFVRLANAELGEGGCGVWQVRPRLGLVGMLMGWWQVKLSSGCPRPGRG
jgi:hypothetical protein